MSVGDRLAIDLNRFVLLRRLRIGIGTLVVLILFFLFPVLVFLVPVLVVTVLTTGCLFAL